MKDKILNGVVSFVTGGSRGIGRGICLALASAGSSVVVASLHKKRADKVVNKIRDKYSSDAMAVGADVRSGKDLENALKKTLHRFGAINVLVNNAGVVNMSPVMDLNEDDWDYVFDINVKGVFLASQIFGKQMIKQGIGGRIINISSIGYKVRLINRAHYCASKAAVDAFTRVLALELAPYKITVNSLCPGTVKTDLLEYIEKQEAQRRGVSVEKIVEELKSKIPLGRLLTPIDIGKVAIFLASNEFSDAITGQCINVDGGESPW